MVKRAGRGFCQRGRVLTGRGRVGGGCLGGRSLSRWAGLVSMGGAYLEGRGLSRAAPGAASQKAPRVPRSRPPAEPPIKAAASRGALPGLD